jgi:hypothetical protein
MNQTIPPVQRLRTCSKCGHRQLVTSAVAEVDAQGEKHYWFGSSYDFCDKCDGPMTGDSR